MLWRVSPRRDVDVVGPPDHPVVDADCDLGASRKLLDNHAKREQTDPARELARYSPDFPERPLEVLPRVPPRRRIGAPDRTLAISPGDS
jgi:hypothetical protein